jgi:hypothetical protein
VLPVAGATAIVTSLLVVGAAPVDQSAPVVQVPLIPLAQLMAAMVMNSRMTIREGNYHSDKLEESGTIAESDKK